MPSKGKPAAAKGGKAENPAAAVRKATPTRAGAAVKPALIPPQGETQARPRVMPHLSVDERVARGKAARAETPRSSHGGWQASELRLDPVELLEVQGVSRVQELLPIRYGRMVASPFTFYRGAAAVMAADLASTPRSGLIAQTCGDAHLSNFGVFLSPERALVFDINDFDETLPGPWEWDVKRLAASLEIAGRSLGFEISVRRECVLTAVRAYRDAMAEFAAKTNMEVWYAHLDVEAAIGQLRAVQAQAGKKAAKADRRVADRAQALVDKARTKDSLRAFSKLTHVVDGEPRILADPPLLVPLEDLLTADQAATMSAAVMSIFRSYRTTLPDDRKRLLEQFRAVDVARKVVGVGSVGTRAWIVLGLGRDFDDPLFLQFKEAQPSVLEAHLGRSRFANHGRRVVEGQRLMQASGDIMLGWTRISGIDGQQRDFYVRQLWDGKGSFDVENARPAGAQIYARLCSWTLARAHARSGDRIAIAAYLGGGDVFPNAIADFSTAYADQNERDHAELAKAVKSGRVPAELGI
jgi:uncharacterized protein (DUF2252 family)